MFKKYFKKSHSHKPKKGRRSYRRLPEGLTPEVVDEARMMINEPLLTVEEIREMQEILEEQGDRPRYIILHGELVHIDNLSDEELADKIKEHDDQYRE